ncbi:MAG: hypothetical protein AAGF87_18675, partial [Bacteroidota bacterium]
DQDVHFSWEGQAVPQHIQAWVAPRSFPTAEKTLKAIRFLTNPPAGAAHWPNRYRTNDDLTSKYDGPSIDPSSGTIYAHTPDLLPEYVGKKWADAVSAFVLADWSGQVKGQLRLDLAERIWQQTMPLQDFQPMHLFEQSHGLKHALDTMAGADLSWRSRCNFQGAIGDRLISGQLDWVGQSTSGIATLQSCAVFGKKWSAKLQRHLARLQCNASAYSHFAQQPLVANLIWLPAQGRIIPMPLAQQFLDLLAENHSA